MRKTPCVAGAHHKLGHRLSFYLTGCLGSQEEEQGTDEDAPTSFPAVLPDGTLEG